MLKSSLELEFMKPAAIKPVTRLFLIYFLFGSLIFLGQDLSVHRKADGAWTVSLAEHSHSNWGQPLSDDFSFNDSRQNCSHKHQANEIHICLDHHRFLTPHRVMAVSGESSLRSGAVTLNKNLHVTGLSHFQSTVPPWGHDPGLELLDPASFSILRL